MYWKKNLYWIFTLFIYIWVHFFLNKLPLKSSNFYIFGVNYRAVHLRQYNRVLLVQISWVDRQVSNYHPMYHLNQAICNLLYYSELLYSLLQKCPFSPYNSTSIHLFTSTLSSLPSPQLSLYFTFSYLWSISENQGRITFTFPQSYIYLLRSNGLWTKQIHSSTRHELLS